MTIEYLRIREATAGDFESILTISKTAGMSPFRDNDTTNAVTYGTIEHWVAVSDGLVRGFVVADVTPDFVHIIDIVVDPVLRRRGVGTALMDHLKDRLTNLPRGSISVNVWDRNEEAQKFFHRVGFATAAESTNVYGSDDAVARRMVFQNARS